MYRQKRRRGHIRTSPNVLKLGPRASLTINKARLNFGDTDLINAMPLLHSYASPRTPERGHWTTPATNRNLRFKAALVRSHPFSTNASRFSANA